MFRRTILKPVLLVGVIAAGAAYCFAPWLQAEWSIYKGKQAFARGEFQTAIDKLSPLVDRQQGFSVACWGQKDCATHLRRALAQSHLALGQDDAALSHYQQLTDSTARFVLGLAALKGGKWDESIGHFERVLADDDCEVCKVALDKAKDAKAAQANSVEANKAQTKALAAMITPTVCLCVVAGIHMFPAGAIINPRLVNLVRQAGVAKRVAEGTINGLMLVLGPKLKGTITSQAHAYPHSSAAMVCDLTADMEVADGVRQG